MITRRVRLLLATAAMAVMPLAAEPAPKKTEPARSTAPAAKVAPNCEAPAKLSLVSGSLPPGCYKYTTFDPVCFESCIEAGGRTKACRSACTETIILCDTFPPII